MGGEVIRSKFFKINTFTALINLLVVSVRRG